MNSNLLKICLASLLALSFTACGDDDNGDNNGGNGGENISCTAGDKKCSPDNTALLVCNAAGNAWGKGDACPFGCENNACKADPNGGQTSCTANEKKCNDGNTGLLVCNAAGNAWDKGDACAFGCENNACKSDPNGGQTSCTANEKKCNDDNTGLLVCNAAGNAWDKGDDCAFGCENNACKEDPNGGETQCTENETKCNDDRTAVLTCNAEGTWDEEACTYGCNSGACVQHTVLEEGAECNPETYFDTCKADGVLNYCGLVDYNEDGDYVYGVLELDCPAKEKVCDIVNVSLNGKSERYGDCFTENEECSTSGEVSQTCDEEEFWGEIYATETASICSASLSTSKSYWVEKKNECIMGGCKDDTACLDPLVEDLFEDCTAESRPDRCDGTVYSTCYYDEDLDEEYVAAADCAENDNVCAQVSGKMSCYNTCEEANDTPTPICYYSASYETFVVGTSICVKDDSDDKLIQVETLTKGCASGCNETNDGCAYADEGDKCPEGMTESCVDNAAVYCYGGNIAAESCPGLYGENQICYINEDDESWCAEKCDTLDEVATECITEEFLGSEYAYQVSKTCTQTKDNKLIYVYDKDDRGKTKIEFCDDQGCNKDNTACIAIDEEDEG